MTDPSASQRDQIDELAESFVARFRSGERPSIDEYARKYPHLAEELRELLPALVMLEQHGSLEDAQGLGGSAAPRPAPRELGDFTIVREIGRGGMGVVCEAVQQSLGRHVALKVLSSGGLMNPVHLERFRLEARSAGRLHHSHIVPVFGVGEHQGLHYYAMQFIAGQSLDQVIEALRKLRPGEDREKTGPLAQDDFTHSLTNGLLTGRFRTDEPAAGNGAAGPAEADAKSAERGGQSHIGREGDSPIFRCTEKSGQSPAQSRDSPQPTPTSLTTHSEFTSSSSGRPFYDSVARVGLQVAEALAYAHAEGILHRDIKPSNLLLDAKGNTWVTDFGLAKAEENEALTQTGDFVGTLRYMAPERLEGWSDRRSDIYGLGATLYELLTLRPFFESSSRAQLIDHIRHVQPQPPTKIDPAIPRDLETIVLKALSKEPASRYHTAEEMADDLRRFLSDRPILARRSTTRERLVRWCRRNPVAASLIATAAAVVLAMLLIGWHVNGKFQAAALVEQLVAADVAHVPGIITRIDGFRRWANPLLRAQYEESAQGSSKKLHAALGLLSVDESQVSPLQEQLLVVTPSQFPIVRDALIAHKNAILEPLWKAALNPSSQTESRFQAACALASYAPQDRRWNNISTLVATHLVSRQASEFVAWGDALRPARGQLIAALSAIHRDTKDEHQSRLYATEALADYAAGRPEVLFDLLADAEPFQFPIIFQKLTAHRPQAIAMVGQELAKHPKEQASEDEREALAKRQANAAIALYRMGDHEKVWPVLKFSPDPRVRSYLIHWLSPLGGNPQAIIDRLDSESDVTIRRTLVLTLGEFTEAQLPEAKRQPLIEKLLTIFENEPDAGLHGAAEWLLRKWGQNEQLQAVVEKLRSNEEQLQRRTATDKRQWYVNTQGQTMVLVDAGEFSMGSPESEPQRDSIEVLHRRRIGRRFAISTKEVTREQFLRFKSNFSYSEFSVPEPDCPIGRVLWYEAAEYCNWLSEKEGIPKDRWCYEVNEQGQFSERMKIREDYLELAGYRLPTEAEWEYSCRAGTLTSRYYGVREDLLASYAWYIGNSKDVTHPTGRLMPNDFGLFDMHGNVYEWCQETYQQYAAATALGEIVAHKADAQPVKDSVTRVLRGGAFNYVLPGTVRSARRDCLRPGDRNFNVGFRPARTYP